MRLPAFPLLLLASHAGAAEVVVTRLDDPVPDGCTPADCSLREAVLLANVLAGADRIVLPASALPYQLSRTGIEDAALNGDLDVTQSLEIVGQGEAPVAVAQLVADRLFDVSGASTHLVLGNVRLQGGNGVAQGGAVRVAGATLAVADCEFLDNTSTVAGGAISMRGPDGSFGNLVAVIERTRFENNRAPVGGAFAHGPSLIGSTSTRIVDSEFLDNVAVTLGGAIGATQDSAVISTLDVSGTLFRGNEVSGSASGQGGAIGLPAGSAVEGRIADCEFVDNHARGATGRGGALANVEQVSASDFLANSATRGGALANVRELDGSLLCDNVAHAEGGAIVATLGLSLRRNTFCRNTAADRGGALQLALGAGSDALLERNTFDQNIAATGGSIAMDDGDLRLLQNTLVAPDMPPQGTVGTLLRYDGPDAAASGSRVEFVGNLMRGRCSFAAGVGVVDRGVHNVHGGGDTCGLSQAGAAFANNALFASIAGVPLGSLVDNGGPTPTRSPGNALDHPARDRVPTAACIERDQRGFLRVDAICDAGAVEADGVPPPEAIFENGFE